MVNDNYLRIFKERLALRVEKQLVELDKDIEAAKRKASAKGLLKSGCMINGIKGLCFKVLESRVDYIIKILDDLPFKYSHNLGERISKISLHYFPSDLGEIFIRLDGIIRLSNGERLRERIINEVVDINNSEINRFKTLLDQFLLTLKRKQKSPIRRLVEHPIWNKVIAGLILAIGTIIIKILWEKFTK